MKILLLQIDKTQDAYLEQGIGIYLKRLKNYIQLEVKSLQVSKAMRQRSAGEQKMEEARLLIEEIKPEDEVLLLDENGKEFSSQQFAEFLQKKQNASVKRLVFVIGGPYGFDERIYERAKAKISLSKMTFSHQMVRLFFVEQVYRAYTILKGEKYHHE
ncbi:MAG: 23S rRNA (pseudouridine(1915)-N(3))-methyltransferase RlmH [Bacteroidia bacterium]|nr:23S rRNA (pseudouridine(1915)-N(3))-methyltransferase RlmH [Bacteroidia bacterium]